MRRNNNEQRPREGYANWLKEFEESAQSLIQSGRMSQLELFLLKDDLLKAKIALERER